MVSFVIQVVLAGKLCYKECYLAIHPAESLDVVVPYCRSGLFCHALGDSTWLLAKFVPATGSQRKSNAKGTLQNIVTESRDDLLQKLLPHKRREVSSFIRWHCSRGMFFIAKIYAGGIGEGNL